MRRHGSQEGDFSRLPFEPDKHYRGVQMQQGRVQLDSDWNAQLDILGYGIDTALADVIGAHGGPEGCAGFAIEPEAVLSFDGVSQLVEIAPSRAFDFAGRQPFALEVRVRPRRLGKEGVLVSRLVPGVDPGGYRLTLRADGRVAFSRRGRAWHDDEPAGRHEVTTDRALEPEIWTRVGARFDGQEIRLYLDGVLAGRGPSAAELPPADVPLLFGAAHAWDPIHFFEGELADVKLVSTEGETTWPLNEGRGVTVTDRRGTHPGVLVGGVEDRWHLHDLSISAGRYYVEGVLAENDQRTRYTDQPDFPGARLPHGDGRYHVYLDVWQRTITWIQDPEIREIALGGPDTTVRAQTVAQVKIRHDNEPEETREEPRMAARRLAEGHLGNLLYRVEIHDPGRLGAEVSRPPTCKWSRQNGSVVFPIAPVRPGVKEIVLPPGTGYELALKAGDWLEVLDDAAVLRNEARHLVQIAQVDTTYPRLYLNQAPPLGVGEDANLQPFIRLWNQQGTDLVGGTLPILPDKWIPLENGVEVRFQAGGSFRTGDYWWLVARSATGDIQWPEEGNEPASLPPEGIGHLTCPLATLEVGPQGVRVRDRRRIFPPLTRLGAGGDVPAGLAVLSESPLPPPGWSATGHYVVAQSLRPGWSTRDLPFPSVCWLAGAMLEGRLYLVTESAVYRFDPANPDEPPQLVARLPEPRRDSGVAALGGRLYVVGGFSMETGEPTGRNDELDPRTGTWCARTPLPVPRGSLALAASGRHLHALGGREEVGPEGLSALHDRYDPATDSWSSAVPLPAPLAAMGAATLERGEIVLAGGHGAGGPVASVSLLKKGAFSSLADLPWPASSPALAVLSGTLWILGGRNGAGWTSRVATYEAVEQRFRPRQDLSQAPRLPVAVASGDSLEVLSPQGHGGGLLLQLHQGPAVFYVVRKDGSR